MSMKMHVYPVENKVTFIMFILLANSVHSDSKFRYNYENVLQLYWGTPTEFHTPLVEESRNISFRGSV